MQPGQAQVEWRKRIYKDENNVDIAANKKEYQTVGKFLTVNDVRCGSSTNPMVRVGTNGMYLSFWLKEGADKIHNGDRILYVQRQGDEPLVFLVDGAPNVKHNPMNIREEITTVRCVY